MFDSGSLRKLEYREALQQLEPFFSTPYNAQRLRELLPSAELPGLQKEFALVREAQTRLRTGEVRFGAFRSITEAVKAAKREQVLQASDLLEIADTCAAAGQLKKALLPRRGEDTKFPLLEEMAGSLASHEKLCEAISRAVDDKGEVADSASEKLARIRRSLGAAHSRVRERLHGLINSQVGRDALQEPVITMRNGRYCVPVRAEHKSQVKGLVHDKSSSGATLFVEPMAVVEMGNKIAELEADEASEIARILQELSARVGEVAESVLVSLETAAELDFAFGRARFAQERDCCIPEISLDATLDLRRARHPLLTGDVVPINVGMDAEKRCLIITGPNTGGKTVTLKTIGLLTLLAHSGIPITADAGSIVPLRDNVFADIGDEQSIAQSLSTFSSHVTNIVKIVGEATRQSMVLLDELGAGTDPAEGAALGQSLLETIIARGALCAVTTHYGELKAFALQHPNVQSASCEFDLESLRPTYKLRIGIPGESNALHIAKRLGMADAVVVRARELIGSQRLEVEKLINELRRMEAELADRKRELETQVHQAAEREKEMLKEKRLAFEFGAKQLEAAERRADEMLRLAEEEVEAALKQVRHSKLQPAELEKIRQTLRAARNLVSVEPSRLQAESAPDLQVGDTVQIGEGGPIGRLTSIRDKDAQVLVGTMSVSSKLANLILRDDLHPARHPRSSGGRSAANLEKAMTAQAELNIIAKHADEAESDVERFLNDSLMSGLSPVRIVHGRGTGALRKLVRQIAKEHPQVLRFYHPPLDQGGDAVTVLEFK